VVSSLLLLPLRRGGLLLLRGGLLLLRALLLLALSL